MRNLTIPEVATELRCSERTVEKLIAERRLPHRKLQGLRRILIPRDELERFLAGGVELEVIENNGTRIVRVVAD